MGASAPTSSFEFESAPALVIYARKLLPYVVVAALAALYLFPFVRVLTWSPDEGASEYGAQLILRGGMPARDFLEFYAPGSYYWLALIFKIFGTSIAASRGLLLVEGTAIAVLIFHLSRRIGGVGLFAVAFVVTTSIPMAVMNSPHYDADMFALLSFTLFLAAEGKLRMEGANRRTGYLLLFVASLLAGWVSCLLQEKGLYLAIAFAASLFVLQPRMRRRCLAILSAGYVLPLAVEFSCYARAGALGDLIYTTLLLPMTVYPRLNAVPYGYPLWEIAIPGWFSDLHASLPWPFAVGIVAALGAPFLAMLAFPIATPGLACLQKTRAFSREWLPYWFVAFAILASELHRWDIGHMRSGCLLLAVLFFTLCELSPNRFFKHAAVVITVFVILNGTNCIFGAAAAKTPLHTRRGTLYARENDPALSFLLEHTRPGDYVFVYPHRPVYYFLADLRNPTQLGVFLYDPAADYLFRQAVENIERKNVRYVLWDTVLAGDRLRSIFPAYRHPPPDRQIMEPYLESHYRQIAFANGFRILERIPSH